MRWAVRAVTAGLPVGVAAFALAAAGPDAHDCSAFLTDPRGYTATGGTSAAVSVIVGLTAWLVLGWLVVGVGAVAACRLPGTSGAVAEAIADRTLPAALRRACAMALGITLAAGTGSAGALSTTALTPPGSSSTVGTVHAVHTAPDPTTGYAVGTATGSTVGGTTTAGGTGSGSAAGTPGFGAAGRTIGDTDRASVTRQPPVLAPDFRQRSTPDRSAATGPYDACGTTGLDHVAASPATPATAGTGDEATRLGLDWPTTGADRTGTDHTTGTRDTGTQDTGGDTGDGDTGDRAPVQRVVVRPGDCLWRIARAHLPAGASDAEIAASWPRWYAANRAVIGDDPDLIYPGQVLTPPG